MKIKTAELFCASPASTAICTTMNHHAMVRRGSGGTPRPINPKHYNYYNNHYQFDFVDKPKFKVPAIPCTSQQHIDPKPYSAYLQKARKSTSAASIEKIGDDLIARRKSSAELKNSSKYLLNNPVFVADVRDVDGVCNKGALVVSDPIWPDYSYDDSPRIKKSLSSSRRSMGSESPALVKSRSSSIRLGTTVESPRLKSLMSISRSRPGEQVVELRVSIHCKGCEGKVRKHLSKMEGVKSFHIDLESKKVTVVGDVTPSGVLSSISKVKNAQLWPASPSSASSSPYISIGY